MGRHLAYPVHSTAHAFPYLISLTSLKLCLIIFLGLVGILRSSCKLFFLKPLRRSLVFMLMKGIYLLLVFGDPLQMELFHVKSAYELSIGSSWNFIWKLKIPPRVKVFIWLLTQKKILTNVQRVRRHLSRDHSCSLCHYHEESLHHLFVTCPCMVMLWRSLYLPEGLINFYFSNFDSWLKDNLCYNAGHIGNLKWCNIFLCCLLVYWKWKCCSIFEPHFLFVLNRLLSSIFLSGIRPITF